MIFDQSLNKVRLQTTQIAEGRTFQAEKNEYKIQGAGMNLVCFGGGKGRLRELSEGEQWR